jgi:hypothetical protein
MDCVRWRCHRCWRLLKVCNSPAHKLLQLITIAAIRSAIWRWRIAATASLAACSIFVAVGILANGVDVDFRQYQRATGENWPSLLARSRDVPQIVCRTSSVEVVRSPNENHTGAVVRDIAKDSTSRRLSVNSKRDDGNGSFNQVTVEKKKDATDDAAACISAEPAPRSSEYC